MIHYTIQPRVGDNYRITSPIHVSVLDHQGPYAGVLFKLNLGGLEINTWGPPNLESPENPDFSDTESRLVERLRGMRNELGMKEPTKVNDQDRAVAKAIDTLISFN